MRPIVLNSSNVVEGSNNSKYRFRFASTTRFDKDVISLSNINLYYSWFNITAQNNNNSFSYIWTDGVGGYTYTVSIPDGAYEISTLNAYFQYVMVQNGHYLVDDNKDYVYYAEIVLNPTYYAVEIKTYPLPTSLPSGWTNPAGVAFPAVASTPQVIIPATNIRTLLGFDAGTYPSAVQATAYNILSQNTPQVATVQSVILLCSLLNNTLTNPNTFLYSIAPSNTQFGQLLSVSVPEFVFTDIVDGFYDFFEITLVDQEYRPINIKDPNLVIQLVVKKRDYFEPAQKFLM
jgi:hypothetical protein